MGTPRDILDTNTTLIRQCPRLCAHYYFPIPTLNWSSLCCACGMRSQVPTTDKRCVWRQGLQKKRSCLCPHRPSVGVTLHMVQVAGTMLLYSSTDFVGTRTQKHTPDADMRHCCHAACCGMLLVGAFPSGLWPVLARESADSSQRHRIPAP